MKWLFLMDPLETIHPEKDTTYILMLAAHRAGNPVYYLPKGGIVLKDERVWFHALHVTPQNEYAHPFLSHQWAHFSEEEVQVVFIRTDPPFDADYLMHTWLLDRLSSSVIVMNRPSSIRMVNEKIWATQFHNLIPATLVTRHKQDALAFRKKHNTVVVKPTNGFGGSAVFVIKEGDTNFSVIFETVTQTGKYDAILQQFIPEADKGDKRILLLNGTILGAVLRVHPEGDHRNNFFSGGKAVATNITDRDREIVAILAPHLQALGLYFVGIDIIGDRLMEVNVTSPTCLQEMNRLYHLQLEDTVIAFVHTLLSEKESL